MRNRRHSNTLSDAGIQIMPSAQSVYINDTANQRRNRVGSGLARRQRSIVRQGVPCFSSMFYRRGTPYTTPLNECASIGTLIFSILMHQSKPRTRISTNPSSNPPLSDATVNYTRSLFGNELSSLPVDTFAGLYALVDL